MLRDGSHYLRTELKLTAAHDTKLFAVVPMLYEMDVHNAGSAPRKVGNTRGAVLLSDKIFAGLETPMGLNTVGAGDEDELPSLTMRGKPMILFPQLLHQCPMHSSKADTQPTN